MRYDQIATRNEKRDQLRLQRKAQLYLSLWRDIAAIIKCLLPPDRAKTVHDHAKSIFYALIELKTGKRPDKI